MGLGSNMAESDLAETGIVSQSETDKPAETVEVASDVGKVEASIVLQPGIAGQTVIDDQVVEAVAGTAALEIEGVTNLGSNSVRRLIAERLGGAQQRRARGVGVMSGQREAIVDIEIKVAYGFSIPAIAQQMRESVSLRVLDICGLVTKEINITVTAVEFAYSHSSPFARVGQITTAAE